MTMGHRAGQTWQRTWTGMRSSKMAMPAMAAGKVSWIPTITSTHTASRGPAHKKVKYGAASSNRRTSLLTRLTTCNQGSHHAHLQAMLVSRLPSARDTCKPCWCDDCHYSEIPDMMLLTCTVTNSSLISTRVYDNQAISEALL